LDQIGSIWQAVTGTIANILTNVHNFSRLHQQNLIPGTSHFDWQERGVLFESCNYSFGMLHIPDI
jgi:hypothetical protein